MIQELRKASEFQNAEFSGTNLAICGIFSLNGYGLSLFTTIGISEAGGLSLF